MGSILSHIAGALAGATSGPGVNKSTEVNVSCCSTEVIPPMSEEVIEEDSESEDQSPRRHVTIRRSNASTGSLGSHGSHRSWRSNHSTPRHLNNYRIKMTTSIFVDSRFAKRGNDSNFHIELRESITVSDNARVRVDNIRFIDSFLTTDSGEYIYLKNGDSFTAVGIPEQAYTGARLASMIQSLTGKTTTYSDATNSLIVSYDENTRILSDGKISQMHGNFPPGSTPHHPRSLNRCLGPSIIEKWSTDFPVRQYAALHGRLFEE